MTLPLASLCCSSRSETSVVSSFRLRAVAVFASVSTSGLFSLLSEAAAMASFVWEEYVQGDPKIKGQRSATGEAYHQASLL